MASLLDRFWSKISPEPNSGCWLWTGAVDTDGYGQFKADDGGGVKNRKAHRWYYERLHGKVPAGKRLRHLCKIRSCANPDHLALDTPRAIAISGSSAIGKNAAKTHCVRGHALTADNLLPHRLKLGWRACAACNRQYWREHYCRRTAA